MITIEVECELHPEQGELDSHASLTDIQLHF